MTAFTLIVFVLLPFALSMTALAVVPPKESSASRSTTAHLPLAARAGTAPRMSLATQGARKSATVTSSRAASKHTVRLAARRIRPSLHTLLARGTTLAGRASWYPRTKGYGSSAHIALPWGYYIPKGEPSPRVRVCAGERCVVARAVDSCGCYVGTRDARLVDMSLGLVRRLGLDPATGLYEVRLTLLDPTIRTKATPTP